MLANMSLGGGQYLYKLELGHVGGKKIIRAYFSDGHMGKCLLRTIYNAGEGVN